MRAREFVETSLAALLPPSAPPFHKRIVSARFDGSGKARYRCADALLELTDGTQAGIEVFEYNAGKTIGIGCQWLSFEGVLVYEGGRWERKESEAFGDVELELIGSGEVDGLTDLEKNLARQLLREKKGHRQTLEIAIKNRN